MEKQSMILKVKGDGTVKLPPDLRRNLGNPEQLGVTRIGSSLVLAPIPERWAALSDHVIFYEQGMIVRDPKVMFGTSVVAGTRIPVRTIIGYVKANYSPTEIQEEFPQLTKEQIKAVIAFYQKRSRRGAHRGANNLRDR